ncbi:hypothetical protein GCM10007173_18940 [Glutamicibacter ardleyensis]|uniref:Uncharacterized protein n=1 Tax=Glutamicibacter ardleyensis TaxID=225894 RepID=A0ABQ2DK62_9MICC|nr:hypothetical protein GCM10007173_18940 [Glutamicibacter ardleyensis]
MLTCALSQESWFMFKVASTKAYRLNGKQATNKYTFEGTPVSGSVRVMVGPDQSTSTLIPALCSTREATLDSSTKRWYLLQKRS